MMDIFSLLLPKFKIDKNKKIRLISLFSGYDSQKLAFNYIGVDVEHYRAIEFDKYAIQSLNEIHNTNFETKDITKVSADELGIVDTKNITYLLTYSFPCTDLSLAGKRTGMEKNSGTRSGLLWEVERLLKETKEKPQILIMENVPQVLAAKGWREWNVFLESLGYSNYCQVLNAKNFGIPQNRERCFMVSILGDYSYEFPKGIELKDRLKDFLENDVDEKYYLSARALNGCLNTNYECSKLENRLPKDVIVPTICARDYKDPKLVYGLKALNETLENVANIEKGDYIDTYNKKVNKEIAGTITTGVSFRNNTFVVGNQNMKTNNKADELLILLYKSGELKDKDFPCGVDSSINEPKVRDISNCITSRYDAGIQNQKQIGMCVVENQNMKTTLCNSLIENGVVKENFYNKQYLGTYQFAKSEAFMNGKDRFEPNKEFIDCILTSQKVGVVENGIVRTIKAGEGSDNMPKVIENNPNGSYNYQLSDLRIRKLTPCECFKLMGVKPSDYNNITCSNAQKYKQAGNSIVTTVLMAIYSQLFENCDYKYYIEELLRELRSD